LPAGWTYIFYPTIEVYSMPYHQLIPKLRQLLESLNSQAIRLENSWMASSLLSERGVSPVNPESKQIRGRTNFQTDRPGMNKGQSIKNPESPDWSQRALAGRDSTPDNQFSHRQPTADAAVQIPRADPITKPYKPAPKPTATAAKPHDTWKAELLAGMALLVQQQGKDILSKQALSERPPELSTLEKLPMYHLH
jgi:hypothetical protein